MNAAPPTPHSVPAPTPLSQDQIAEGMELGRRHARGVRRAATVARLVCSVVGHSPSSHSPRSRAASLATGLTSRWALPSLASNSMNSRAPTNSARLTTQSQTPGEFGQVVSRHRRGRVRRVELVRTITAVSPRCLWRLYRQRQVDAMLVDIAFGHANRLGQRRRRRPRHLLAYRGVLRQAKTVRVFRERTPAWVIEVLAKAG